MKKGSVFALAACIVMAGCVALSGEKELRFSWWGGSERHEATLAALKMFEEKNPGLAVKAEYMGWTGYLERLTTQIGAGSEPDIIQMDWAWLATFSKNGDGFYDLLQIKDSINLDAYDKKWIDICMVNGKLNALPVSFTTRYFFWNKTMWEKAGLPLPATWQEIVDAGPVFRDKLGDAYYPLDMPRHVITHFLASYIFQKTGSMLIHPEKNELGLTLDQLEQMFAFYKELLDNHALTTLAVRSSSSGNPEGLSHEQPDFISGLWAGGYQWDSSIALTLSTQPKEFVWELGTWPGMPDSKNSGRIGRPAQILAVKKNTQYPVEAAECLNYLLTTPEAARVLKVTRGVLISNPSREELEKQDLIIPINIEAMKQLENVDVYSPSPYFEDPRMLLMFAELIENISYGKITPREAAESMHNDVTRLLRRLTR